MPTCDDTYTQRVDAYDFPAVFLRRHDKSDCRAQEHRTVDLQNSWYLIKYARSWQNVEQGPRCIVVCGCSMMTSGSGEMCWACTRRSRRATHGWEHACPPAASLPRTSMPLPMWPTSERPQEYYLLAFFTLVAAAQSYATQLDDELSDALHWKSGAKDRAALEKTLCQSARQWDDSSGTEY